VTTALASGRWVYYTLCCEPLEALGEAFLALKPAEAPSNSDRWSGAYA